jgi:hypothetical protein
VDHCVRDVLLLETKTQEPMGELFTALPLSVLRFYAQFLPLPSICVICFLKIPCDP